MRKEINTHMNEDEEGSQSSRPLTTDAKPVIKYAETFNKSNLDENNEASISYSSARVAKVKTISPSKVKALVRK